MSRMTPGELALALDAIKNKFPEEFVRLTDHIETVSTEVALLAVVREMVEFIEQSKSAEAETARTLESMKVVMDNSVAALNKVAEQDKRSNDLVERQMELEKLKYKHVIAPIVSCFVGAITAWLAIGSP